MKKSTVESIQKQIKTPPGRGEVIYIKRAQKSIRGAQEFTFNGYGVALLIGQTLPMPNAHEVTESHLFRVLGTCGLITFDDISDFLGEEKAAECIKKFEDKYYEKPPEELDAKAAAEKEKSIIIAPDGVVQ